MLGQDPSVFLEEDPGNPETSVWTPFHREVQLPDGDVEILSNTPALKWLLKSPVWLVPLIQN